MDSHFSDRDALLAEFRAHAASEAGLPFALCAQTAVVAANLEAKSARHLFPPGGDPLANDVRANELGAALARFREAMGSRASSGMRRHG